MAKNDKVSQDKLLEQALVKDEDIPYDVPNNWVWTKVGCVSDFERGITFPSSAKNNEEGENLIPCIRTANIQERLEIEDLLYIDRSYMKNNKNKLLKLNDILMSSANSRELVGKVSYVENLSQEMTFGGFVLNIRAQKILSKLLFYYLRLEFLSGNFMGQSTQTTNIANINSTILGQYLMPLPPLPEQQRIVNIIESLFEKLDHAKELAQNALDSFENRKAAILHKAFTGELTAKWREVNGVDFNWEIKILKDVSDFRAGYAFDSSKFSDDGYQVIRMGNLYNGVLDLSRNPVFVKPEDIDQNILKRSKINIGDILLTLTGTKYKRDYGFAVLITEKADVLLNQRILSLTAKNVETIYLLNYLKTDLFRDVFFSNETGGVNQGNVSSKFVETIEIPIPPQSEQKEIIRILDNLLKNEQKAKELCDVLNKIDIMKKSILARAFRGGLGTNYPEEESALELLKQVLQEKISKD
jgi:type I restriction enzyme S subunit